MDASKTIVVDNGTGVNHLFSFLLSVAGGGTNELRIADESRDEGPALGNKKQVDMTQDRMTCFIAAKNMECTQEKHDAELPRDGHDTTLRSKDRNHQLTLTAL